MPSVKTGLHHRRYLGFFKILGLEPKHFALFYGQCVVVHVGPRIIDQFVALMLPDDSLYLERSGTLDVTPAVTTVGRVGRFESYRNGLSPALAAQKTSA